MNRKSQQAQILALFLCLLLVLAVSGQTLAAIVISKPVGEVGGHIVTSREVQLNYLIERAMATPDKDKFLRSDRWLLDDDKRFRRELGGVFYEWLFALEAKTLSFEKIDPGLLKVHIERSKKIKESKFWSRLKASDNEIKAFVERKLKAKNFVQFRRDTIEVDVTDDEVKAYYQNNKEQFADLEFEKYKAMIRDYLKNKNVSGRLQEWSEILRKKYKVRSYLLINSQ